MPDMPSGESPKMPSEAVYMPLFEAVSVGRMKLLSDGNMEEPRAPIDGMLLESSGEMPI
jgi:hypothetical protein